jgi:hypothetical protein
MGDKALAAAIDKALARRVAMAETFEEQAASLGKWAEELSAEFDRPIVVMQVIRAVSPGIVPGVIAYPIPKMSKAFAW